MCHTLQPIAIKSIFGQFWWSISDVPRVLIHAEDDSTTIFGLCQGQSLPGIFGTGKKKKSLNFYQRFSTFRVTQMETFMVQLAKSEHMLKKGVCIFWRISLREIWLMHNRGCSARRVGNKWCIRFTIQWVLEF